jgi:hypothetical protein
MGSGRNKKSDRKQTLAQRGYQPLIGSMRIYEQEKSEHFFLLKVRYGVPRVDVFGDESSSKDIVSYGLVIVDRTQTAALESAFQEVLDDYAQSKDARFHAVDLFAGDQRRKPDSKWKHLTRDQCSELCISLANTLVKFNTSFSVGVVHKNTYPDDMPDDDGKPIKINNEHHYIIGFCAAAASFLRKGAFYPNLEHKCIVDPLPNCKVNLVGCRNVWVEKVLALTDLKPTSCGNPKPILIDAADLLAYCSARAYSSEDHATKDVCRSVIDILSPLVTDAWWNPGKTLIPKILEKVNANVKYGTIRAWHNPLAIQVLTS